MKKRSSRMKRSIRYNTNDLKMASIFDFGSENFKSIDQGNNFKTVLKFPCTFSRFIFSQIKESNFENKNMLAIFFIFSLAIITPFFIKSIFLTLVWFINDQPFYIFGALCLFLFLMASFSFSIVKIEGNLKAMTSMVIFIAIPFVIAVFLMGLSPVLEFLFVHKESEIYFYYFFMIILGLIGFFVGYIIMYALNKLACEINDPFKFFTTLGVFIVGVSSILGAYFAYQALHQPAVQPITIQTNGNSTVVGKYNITIQPVNKKH